MADSFLDLDQARAARREAKGEQPTFRFGGETFVMPVEVPLAVGDAFVESNVAGMKALVGEDQWERFMSHDPTIDDLEALAEWIASVYGFGDDLGKSRRSPQPSTGTGGRSRRTSKRSTGSTSDKPAGVPTR